MNNKWVLYVTIIIGLCSSCNQKLKYQGDWIVMDAEYDKVDILNFIIYRKMRINFEREGGTTPTVNYLNFEDKDIAYDVEFKYYEIKGKEYLTIQGSKFFTDTFEVKCLTEGCCRISLENDTKYVELIFNGELSTFEKRRDCPYVMDVLEPTKE